MSRPSRRLILSVLLLLVSASGCAYFNTFSNARKYFREAEDLALDPAGKVTAQARTRYDECIRRCQNVLDNYPESKWVDDALLLMSRAYFRKSEFRRCLRRLAELDERFPDHDFREEELYMRGISLLETGEESSAIQTLGHLESEFPRSPHLAEGIYRSSEADFRLGNWEAALNGYSRLLELFETSDWNDRAHQRSGFCLLELGSDSLAVDAFLELGERATDRRIAFEGRLKAVEILLDQHRLAEARVLADDLEEIAPQFQSDAALMLLSARIYEANGEDELARVLLESVTTLSPGSTWAAEAWYRLGLARQLRDADMETALEAFSQVVSAERDGIWADLATRKRSAIETLLSVRESSATADSDSTQAELQFRMAENQFLRLENLQEALSGYRKVYDEYADSPWAPRAGYAICYLYRYELQDTTAALAAVSDLRERYPDSDVTDFVAHWEEDLSSRDEAK